MKRGSEILAVKTVAVIPAYNEEERIAEVIRRTKALLDVIVVDDGSTDRTASEARGEAVEVISFPANRGKTEALHAGFQRALQRGYEAMVTLDADGQHLPEEIPRFLAAANDGAHIVVGSRMARVETMPTVRLWTNRTTSRVVSWLARTRVLDSQSGYRLFRAEVLRRIRLTADRFAGESEILIQSGRRGFRIVEVPISTVYFGTEGSKIDPFRDTIRFFKLIGSYL
ncbi:MAG: glycosyltransferase family 2 protein [Planctomycetota bacterium]